MIENKMPAKITAEDMIRKIAKGLFSAKQVREILERVYMSGYNDMKHHTFDVAVTTTLQTLHYDSGWGKVRLGRFFNNFSDQIEALDVGAYNLDESHQALKDDADFEFEIKWKED